MHFQNNAVNKTEIKNAHHDSHTIATAWRCMNFGAFDSNFSGGALIISKDFNSFVFQLSNVKKQHTINSLSSGFHMPFITVPSRVDEKPPKAIPLESENKTIWVANGGFIE